MSCSSAAGKPRGGETLPDLSLFNWATLCRLRAASLLASFVFRFALFHQITVLSRHRMRLEGLLANFASSGVGVGGGQPDGNGRAREDQRKGEDDRFHCILPFLTGEGKVCAEV